MRTLDTRALIAAVAAASVVVVLALLVSDVTRTIVAVGVPLLTIFLVVGRSIANHRQRSRREALAPLLPAESVMMSLVPISAVVPTWRHFARQQGARVSSFSYPTATLDRHSLTLWTGTGTPRAVLSVPRDGIRELQISQAKDGAFTYVFPALRVRDATGADAWLPLPLVSDTDVMRSMPQPQFNDLTRSIARLTASPIEG